MENRKTTTKKKKEYAKKYREDKKEKIREYMRKYQEDNKEKLNGSNGLLLSPHVDHLFDRGFISFTQRGELLISSKLNTSVLDDWEIEVPKNVGKFSSSQEDYLSFHRARVFRAS